MDQHLVTNILLVLFVFFLFRFLLLFVNGEKSSLAPKSTPSDGVLGHANELYSQKRYKELENFLRVEISKNPKSLELRKVLVNTYLRQDKQVQATNQLENIVRLAPKDLRARGKLAECYTSLGKFKQATILAEEIYRADTKNSNAVKKLAELYNLAGQSRQALNTYQVYLELTGGAGNTPDIAQIMARLYVEVGENENAFNAYQSITSSNPNDINAQNATLDLAQKLGQWEKCIDICQKLISTKGEKYEYLEKLANAYSNLSRHDEAFDIYQKLVDSGKQDDANYLHYQSALADIYLQRGETSKAIELLSGLIRKYPNEDFLAFSLAQVYVALNDYEKAVALYEDLITTLPSDQINMIKTHISELMCKWAESLFAQGNYSKAFDKYIMAMKYNENDPEICYRFGASNLKINSINDALGHFKRAITINPNEPKYYYALGCANVELGNSKAAQSAFEQALAIEPKNTRYMTALAVVLTKQFINIEQGIEILKEVTSICPNDPDAMFNLALAYDILEDRDLAIEYYKKALDILPTHIEAKHNLGLLGYELSNPLEEPDQLRHLVI